MERAARIYLVGAHATGKTTLARMIRDRYGLPMISEVARGVLAEMEAQVDQLRTNLELVDRYQLEVFERQIQAEASQEGGFVSDRAFCNLAYAAHHSTILPQVFADPKLAAYMDTVRSGVVFFLRPQRRLLVEDGVRETLDWEDVLRIDGMVKLMLEMYGISYLSVESLSMQERLHAVDQVMRLAGVSKSHAEESPSNRVPVAESFAAPESSGLSADAYAAETASPRGFSVASERP